jgi:hypothetical protein
VDENCPPFSGHISSISKQNTGKIVRENHVIILKVDENCPPFSGHISSTSKQDTDKIGHKSHVISIFTDHINRITCLTVPKRSANNIQDPETKKFYGLE